MDQRTPLPALVTDVALTDPSPPTIDSLQAVAAQLQAKIHQNGLPQPPAALGRRWLATTLRQELACDTTAPDPAPTQDLLSLCIASTPARLRRPADLPVQTRLSATLQQVLAAFEADDIVVVIPAADGTWHVHPEQLLGPTATRSRDDHTLTPEEALAASVLAQATAMLGVPVEITTADDTHPTLWTMARRAFPGEDAIYCLPLYQWRVDIASALIGVLVIRRSRLLPPPTPLEWYRNLFLSTHVARVTDAVPIAVPLRRRPSTHETPWHGHVPRLTRDAIPWLPPPHRLRAQVDRPATVYQLMELVGWLAALITRLGLTPPDPAWHPYALKKRLSQAVDKTTVQEIDTSTQTSALSLSQSALENGWWHSVRGMLQHLHHQCVRRDTIVTLFAGYRDHGRFFLTDALEHSLDEAESYASLLLAQVAVLDGGPRFIAPKDGTNPIHRIVRTVLHREVGVAVIPVYAWRYPTSTPAFHGVFIALRHPDAPPPTTAEWLHWQFFCQAMHTPLATIAAEPEAAMLTMQTPQPVAIHPLRLERQR